jgi:hypothetical protein
MSSNLADSFKILLDDIESFAREALNEVPVNDPEAGTPYADSPTSLVNILRDGVFAAEIAVDEIPDIVVGGFLSTAINEMWNDQKVIWLHIDSEKAGFDVCDIENFPGVHEWAYICEDGLATFPLLWDAYDAWSDAYLVPGLNELSDNFLSVELMGKAAVYTQGNTGEYKGTRTLSEISEDLLANPYQQDGDLFRYITANQPVCDLRVFSDDFEHYVPQSSGCTTEDFNKVSTWSNWI